MKTEIFNPTFFLILYIIIAILVILIWYCFLIIRQNRLKLKCMITKSISNNTKPNNFYVKTELNDSLKNAPYVRKELLQQVIKLFRDLPRYRDDRIGAIEFIFQTYYKSWVNINNIKTVSIILFDIDRAFRLIQQHAPELRGEQWKKRQKKGGRKYFYNPDDKEYNDELQDICNQLSLTFND